MAYDYFGKMKLYSADDRNAIYWALNAIYEYDDGKVNEAIKGQISTAEQGANRCCIIA